MTSIKVKFRASAVKGREGTVYYSIIHDRIVRQLTTRIRLMSDEWDHRLSAVITSKPGERRLALLSMREQIRCDVDRLTKIAGRLDRERITYTTDDVIAEYRRYLSDYSLTNYMDGLIRNFRQCGKVRTAETYRAALNSFRKFRLGEDIMLDSLTPELMQTYEAWHKTRGNIPNTVSFYMRILRAVYNRAVDAGMIDAGNPFKRVYTGIDRTVKRAIPLDAISRLRNLDLSLYQRLDYARDMFMMSFYLRGISFIDLALLKKTDLRNGILSYRRRKTCRRLDICWTREMQTLLDKYDRNPTEYLMPIITKNNINIRKAYLNAGHNINRSLKVIARMIGVSVPLTMYVARHSWASAAKVKGVPVSVISQGMGHDSETTTGIYLAQLSSSVVDQANFLILNSL